MPSLPSVLYQNHWGLNPYRGVVDPTVEHTLVKRFMVRILQNLDAGARAQIKQKVKNYSKGAAPPGAKLASHVKLTRQDWEKAFNTSIQTMIDKKLIHTPSSGNIILTTTNDVSEKDRKRKDFHPVRDGKGGVGRLDFYENHDTTQNQMVMEKFENLADDMYMLLFGEAPPWRKKAT